MEPALVRIPPFAVAGLKVRTTNQLEQDPRVRAFPFVATIYGRATCPYNRKCTAEQPFVWRLW